MPPLPIDVTRRRLALALHVDGVRHRRYSVTQARAAWYQMARTARYARFLRSLTLTLGA